MRRRRFSSFSLVSARGVFEDPAPAGSSPKVADQLVVRHAIEPAPRILRGTVLRPRFERGRECRLHGVLGELQMLQSRHPRERRDELAVLAAKEMLRQARLSARAWPARIRRRAGQCPAISRISMRVPGIIIPYISRAISSAWS